MATITEDYVSFETAKLLKEKGFKTPVETGYYGDGRICHNLALDFMDYNHEDGYYSRPTIQMAMKWLREVHNFHVDSSIYTDTDGDSEHEYTYIYWDWLIFNSESGRRIAEPQIGCGRYDSYEQACEAAIKYCLENLI